MLALLVRCSTQGVIDNAYIPEWELLSESIASADWTLKWPEVKVINHRSIWLHLLTPKIVANCVFGSFTTLLLSHIFGNNLFKDDQRMSIVKPYFARVEMLGNWMSSKHPWVVPTLHGAPSAGGFPVAITRYPPGQRQGHDSERCPGEPEAAKLMKCHHDNSNDGNAKVTTTRKVFHELISPLLFTVWSKAWLEVSRKCVILYGKQRCGMYHSRQWGLETLKWSRVSHHHTDAEGRYKWVFWCEVRMGNAKLLRLRLPLSPYRPYRTFAQVSRKFELMFWYPATQRWCTVLNQEQSNSIV